MEASHLPRTHLGVSHIHASGVQSMLDLLSIVDLQEVVASKLDICQLLVVLKEVDGEVHLGGGAGCWVEENTSWETWPPMANVRRLQKHLGFPPLRDQ